MVALVLFEPCAHILVLVRRIVVQDDVSALGDFTVDQLQEDEELLVSMPWEALADQLTGEDIESGEEGGGAVALIVVGDGPWASLLHRQTLLGAVQGLDL